jgi:hydrogenase expression/formation protein HypE
MSVVNAGAESDRILLKHGAGGRAMRGLIADSVLTAFATDPPQPAGILGVSATDDGGAVRVGDRWLVMTTDSHVIHPVFFPGGDIGRLAVCGTTNDLAMMGATEILGLTCAVIVEEGFQRTDLERILASMRTACAEASAAVITGDTKVMGAGEIDGIVINTTGIGWAYQLVRDCGLAPGNRIIVTGTIGDHGMAVMATRHGLELDADLCSDVAPLTHLIQAAMHVVPHAITAMKDPTRGGVAGALHEMAAKSRVGIVLDEARIPVRPSVRGVSELVGIDPLFVANEGKAVIGVRADDADAVLAALRAHPLGRDAAIIGTCVEDHPGRVVLDTGFGRRLVAEPEGELLPRIC